MGYTTPDYGEAAYNDMSILYQADVEAIADGINGEGVVTGCAVTAQGTPNMTVAVASGTIIANNTLTSVSSGNVTITAAHASLPRVDAIKSNSSGTIGVTDGTAASIPLAPSIAATDVLLALVYVPPAAATITSSYITDKRVLVYPANSFHGTLAPRVAGASITLGGAIDLATYGLNFNTSTAGLFLARDSTNTNFLVLGLRQATTSPAFILSRRGSPTDPATKIALYSSDYFASAIDTSYMTLTSQRSAAGDSDYQYYYTLEAGLTGTGSYYGLDIYGFPQVIFDGGNQSSPAGNMTVLLRRGARTTAGQLDSPILMFRGRSYDTTDHTVDWQNFIDVTSNAGASTWRLQSRIDAASYATRMVIDDAAKLGINLFTPLRQVHVQGSSLALVTGNLSGDAVMVIERSDAIVEVASNNSGNWAGGYAIGQHDGAGTLVDKWGIMRRSTTGGNDLRFTFGTNTEPDTNTAQMTLTSAGALTLVGDVTANSIALSSHASRHEPGGADAVKDMAEIVLVFNQTGSPPTVVPNTTYVQWTGIYAVSQVDYSAKAFTQCRIGCRASGNEAGSGKGLEAYDSTSGAAMCAVTWNGNTEDFYWGSWTAYTPTAADKAVQLYVKGSSATETITARWVKVQFK